MGQRGTPVRSGADLVRVKVRVRVRVMVMVRVRVRARARARVRLRVRVRVRVDEVALPPEVGARSQGVGGRR